MVDRREMSDNEVAEETFRQVSRNQHPTQRCARKMFY